MENLTNAIIRLYLEKGDLIGALQTADELEKRTLNRDEWQEAKNKISQEKIRKILIRPKNQKAQDAFISWLEGGHDIINLVAASQEFGKEVNLKKLQKMMLHHIKEGEFDSAQQICAGVPLFQKNCPEKAHQWALCAKDLAIKKANIDTALKAAELSDPLNEEEIKSLLTSHVEALIEASQKEKNGAGKSREVLTECKRIMELFNSIPPEKQSIYAKIRQLIFPC